MLNSVNPPYWKLAALKAEMHMHLDVTTEEAVARLKSDWTGGQYAEGEWRCPCLAEALRELLDEPVCEHVGDRPAILRFLRGKK